MSLEGISEPYFAEIVRRELFRGYKLLYPGIVPKVDMLVAERFLFVEIEDTIAEIYSGTKQLIQIALISKIFDGDFVLIAPYPAEIASINMPATYFFRETSKVRLRRKELWLVRFKEEIYVISII